MREIMGKPRLKTGQSDKMSKRSSAVSSTAKPTISAGSGSVGLKSSIGSSMDSLMFDPNEIVDENCIVAQIVKQNV